MISLFGAIKFLCSWLPIFTVGTLLISLLVAIRFRFRALWIVGGFLVLTSAWVGVLQIQVQMRPAFDVLFLSPDPVLGWKHVPNLRWTWAGFARYSDEFDVAVETNSHGFRDLERQFEKGPGVVRVAMLGASMIEALQVPFEETAGQVLEQRLNAEPPVREEARQFEVLNFGVSAYGTGQTLVAWEEYARRFGPDYVFLYLSPLAMELAVETHQAPRFTGARRKLQVRPSFRVESGELVRSPPVDTAAFISGQERLMRNVYGGTRTRRRHYSVLLACSLALQRGDVALLRRPCADGSEDAPLAKRYSVSDDEVREVNLAIVRELGRQVDAAGARFAVIDDTAEHSLGSANLREVLRAFCDEWGLGYIPLYRDLAQARDRGVSTHFERDIHFNKAGNKLLGAAMYRWIASAAR